MQERVSGLDGGSAAPGWYLTRDNKQYGPLTDRELSLFAEGGNFKAKDMLWTQGLDGWKPADAIFGLAPKVATRTTATQATTPPQSDADISSIVEALAAATEPRKASFKERAIEELKKLAAIFVYLWVVFIVLLVHEWVVLSENHIGFRFYGLAAINALVLAKIMLVAEHFRFAERLNQKPLIYSIFYKSVAFTTLLFLAYMLEEMLVGWFQGNGFLASLPQMGGSVLGALSIWLIFCVALLPFFAYREIERAIGPAEFRLLMFGR